MDIRGRAFENIDVAAGLNSKSYEERIIAKEIAKAKAKEAAEKLTQERVASPSGAVGGATPPRPIGMRRNEESDYYWKVASTLSSERDMLLEEIAAVEEILEQSGTFERNPAESLADAVENLVQYIYRLEGRLDEAAETISMVRSLVEG